MQGTRSRASRGFARRQPISHYEPRLIRSAPGKRRTAERTGHEPQPCRRYLGLWQRYDKGLRVSIAFGRRLSSSERILVVCATPISTGICALYSHILMMGSASQALSQSLSTGIPGSSHAAGLLGKV